MLQDGGTLYKISLLPAKLISAEANELLCLHNPAGNYIFKAGNRNTRTRCEICSKLTIKTPEGRHWRLYC